MGITGLWRPLDEAGCVAKSGGVNITEVLVEVGRCMMGKGPFSGNGSPGFPDAWARG